MQMTNHQRAKAADLYDRWMVKAYDRPISELRAFEDSLSPADRLLLSWQLSRIEEEHAKMVGARDCAAAAAKWRAEVEADIENLNLAEEESGR